MNVAWYAWCFSHGLMHRFHGDPWCTATWIAFPVDTAMEAHEAKHHAYGDARFLHELPAEQQMDVIEAREAQR